MVLRVPRKSLQLSLSSNLPYENISGEPAIDSSVYETTVSQHMLYYLSNYMMGSFDLTDPGAGSVVNCIMQEHQAGISSM